MQPNPVDIRLGRRLGKRRNDYAERAHKKHVRQVVNKLKQETDWRGDLARSVQDVIDIENCTEVYGEKQ